MTTLDESLGDLKMATSAVADQVEELRLRLATIVDERFGVQEVLGFDDLLTRLEQLAAQQHRDLFNEIQKHRRTERDLLRQVADLESEVRRLQGELRSKR